MRVYEILPTIEKSIELAEKSKASTISFFVDKISAVVKLFKRYRTSLTNLTPGGSEYVDDPEFCEKYVREKLNSQHQLLINWKRDQKEKDERIRNLTLKAKGYFTQNPKDRNQSSEDLLKSILDNILEEVK